MTETELRRGIAWLQAIPGHDPESGDPLGLILPQDDFPWPDESGSMQAVPLWKDAWERYTWNAGGQDGASPKPPWQTIKFAVAMGNALHALDDICQNRITAAYGVENVQKEGFDRLRSMEAGAPADLVERITAGNAKRDRLRTRHTAIRTWILALTDLTLLEGIDLADPVYWADTWSPPDLSS